jgi:hypothetical protein
VRRRLKAQFREAQTPRRETSAWSASHRALPEGRNADDEAEEGAAEQAHGRGPSKTTLSLSGSPVRAHPKSHRPALLRGSGSSLQCRMECGSAPPLTVALADVRARSRVRENSTLSMPVADRRRWLRRRILLRPSLVRVRSEPDLRWLPSCIRGQPACTSIDEHFANVFGCRCHLWT